MTDDSNSDGSEELASAFDEDVSEVVQTIMLMRIYDMLTCIARGINPTEADAIFKGHGMGKIFGPAPSFDMEEDVQSQ